MPTPARPGPDDGREFVPPPRRDLRACVLWSARWLIGRGAYYRGPFSVTIREEDGCGGGAEDLVLRSRPADELYTAECGPASGGGAEGGAGAAAAAMVGRLVAALVSPDGMRIMKVVADRGPVAAKVLASAAGVERSRFYSLLADLRERGLIADTGDGYEVADRELWAAVSGRAGQGGGDRAEAG